MVHYRVGFFLLGEERQAASRLPRAAGPWRPHHSCRVGSRMRHIITGGSGFTGRCLASFLVRRGDEVVLFDRRPPTFDHRAIYIPGDATVASDLDRLGLRPGDVVYHLAARQFADAVPRLNRTAWFEAVNVEGTRQVLSAMARSGANKLVFFSTDMTYGVPQSTPVTPSHPL